MKVKVLCFFILLLCVAGIGIAISQCNPAELVNECPANIPNGFTFVKSYELKPGAATSKKVEKSYVFSKNMTYNVATCKSDPNISVKIFDSSRNQVATNFYDNKFITSFGFKCGATGIYYMAFSFDKSDKDCAAAVLAFKK